MLYKSLGLLFKSATYTLWLAYVVVSSTARIMAWIFSTLFRYSFYGSTAAGISKDTGEPSTFYCESTSPSKGQVYFSADFTAIQNYENYTEHP